MKRLCSVIGLSLALLMFPITSHAQVICISNASPPPELPSYEQPPIPEPGYMWTPGYWAGGPYGYFSRRLAQALSRWVILGRIPRPRTAA